MALILEIKSGPLAGHKIPLRIGESLSIGRTPVRAQFVIPHDNHMSGLHFAVECGSSGCRVLDQKSSNGTFLNGTRIQDTMLANGDEIKSGETIFAVKIVADDKLPPAPPPAVVPASRDKTSPATAEPLGRAMPLSPSLGGAGTPQPPDRAMRSVNPTKEANTAHRAAAMNRPLQSESSGLPVSIPPVTSKPVVPNAAGAAGKSVISAFSVMGWSFNTLPDQWQVQEGFGLLRTQHDEFPSSVIATQEHLGGISLQQFVESQISMLRQYLMNPTIEPVVSPRINGADECVTVDVHHQTKDGKELVYRRIYARSGISVGILTVTALAADLPQVVKSLQALFEGANFRSTAAPQ